MIVSVQSICCSFYIKMSVTAVALCLAVFLLIIKLVHSLYHRQGIAGPMGLPIIGHLHLLKSPTQRFETWRQTYGDVFQIRLGSWKTLVVCGFKKIREASVTSTEMFSNRPDFIVNQVLRDCLEGEESMGLGAFSPAYLLQRKLTANALNRVTCANTGYLEEVLQQEANQLADMFLTKVEPCDAEVERQIDYAVGSIMYQLLYGRGEDIRKDADFAEALDSIVTVAEQTAKGVSFEFMPWLRYVLPWKFKEYVTQVKTFDKMRQRRVEEQLKMHENNNNPLRNILDMLLAEDVPRKTDIVAGSGELTKERLLGSCTDLMNAGLETLTSAIRWLLLYMVVYPEVQTRVQREIDDVITGGRDVRINDRDEMAYTQATINEVLRIADIFPFGVPRCPCPHVNRKISGQNVSEYPLVFLNLHSIAHDKELWGDPEHFRPERLLTKDNQLDKSKCSHILTFGTGTRRCFGEALARTELFVIFATLLQRCSFSLVPGCKASLDSVPGSVFKPKPFQIRATKRT